MVVDVMLNKVFNTKDTLGIQARSFFEKRMMDIRRGGATIETITIPTPTTMTKEPNFHPKHVLEKNGLFEWEKTSNVECYCGHGQKYHLDGTSICFEGLCICERYENNEEKIVTSPKVIARKNLPEKFAAHFNRSTKPMAVDFNI